jgi:polyisoprenoid-binding protein YceI
LAAFSQHPGRIHAEPTDSGDALFCARPFLPLGPQLTFRRELRNFGRVVVTLVALCAPWSAHAADQYIIDQSVAQIEFTARHFGVLSSQAAFRRFSGVLAIDPNHLERTHIAIQIDATSVEVAWPGGTAMLQSSDYFDTRDYPVAWFTSTDVAAESSDHFRITGLLEIRGVTRPVRLEAAVVDDRRSTSTDSDVALFLVTGQVRRSAFGMTSGTAFIADMVDLRIAVRILFPSAPGHK